MKSILRYTRLTVACAISALIWAAAPIQAQVWETIDEGESFDEPKLENYTHYPIFGTGAIEPRIMIILDNSGSMNFPAYSDGGQGWPSGRTIDTSFKGSTCQQFSTRVQSSIDDGIEQKNTGEIILCNGLNARARDDLDLGRDDDKYTTGRGRWKTTCANNETVIAATRFVTVDVPSEVDGNPVVISNAYIEFTARENQDGDKNFRKRALTLKITAQADDDPPNLSTADYDISSRPDTTASVTWNVPSGEWDEGDRWNAPSTYSTPDLTTIVQELISRPGWQEGNAMLFKIDSGGEDGGRVAHAFDSNPNYAARLIIEYEPCDVETYYGYFDSDSKYSYSSNKFVRDASGSWSGNFLNYLAMRRGDILRKVLVGGDSTSTDGDGKATQIGIQDDRSIGNYKKHHSGSGVSPWSDAWYFVTDGEIEVRASDSWSASTLGTFKIVVEKDQLLDGQDFYQGELSGVLQEIGERAKWGNAWFLSGGSNEGKGIIDYPIGSDLKDIAISMKSKALDTSTPIAETLYVVTQYFKQKNPEISNYDSNATSPFTDERDPYFQADGTEESCAQGFCLLLTDGMATNDQWIPSYLKGFDTASGTPDTDEYARDVALYMHTTDLRPELEDMQNINLYIIFALGDDDNARDLLIQTAKNGGFDYSDENPLPDEDKPSLWDKNDDGLPDNYFEAQNGEELESELERAILDIMEEAGSGTAVSVLATKGEGEGTLVQAIFEPSKSTDSGELKWIGHLHSLWVDDHGMIREDTVTDYKLDTEADERITFRFDDSLNETFIQRYTIGKEDEAPRTTSTKLDELIPIWSAGHKLANMDPAYRQLYTYKGDGTEEDPNLNFFQYNETFFSMLSVLNFTGVNNAKWSYLGVDELSRGINLLQWTLGVPDHDSSYYGNVSLRNRTTNTGDLWKLGDIIHSTPTSMAQPLADYDLLYSDQSYYDYYIKNKNRETVVFVGSNAGMLHAFTGFVYTEDTFVNPYDIDGYFTDHLDTTAGNISIGSELWAYIPQALLPHLKWLADPDYTHVNYIDLRPRIFDAQIFTPSDTHPNGWGSVLVCGLGFAAGMEIPINPLHADPAKRLKMSPSFFAFDVTEPRAPVLLWERSFPNLGMSSNYPNILKVEDNWLIAIGSGPTSIEGTSTHAASLIVVDLKTGGNTAQGGLKNIFTLPGGNAFTNTPVSFDARMNYNVDAVYVAANYNDKTSEVFRLTIPQKDADEFNPWSEDGNPPPYIDDPADPKWTITKLFKSPRPITSSLSLSMDRKNNTWLYFGTGRFVAQADKDTDDQNYIIGIKDPFFNPDLEDCNYTYPAIECEINTLMSEENPLNDLFDADEYSVYGRSTVEGPEGKISFDDMVTEARRNVYQGWYRTLLRTAGSPSERVLNKGAALGGILLMPTFTPSNDPCAYSGSSRLFAVYYETGTAFFRKVFDQDDGEGPVLDVIDLGDGLASSLSIHSGRQKGGKIYVQKSTGEITEIDVDPAFNIKSGPAYWLDDGYY